MALDKIGREGISPEMHEYMLAHNIHHPALAAIRQETLPLEDSRWLITPEQSNFLTVLAQATRARYAFEVGTYTGSSAVSLALGIKLGTVTSLDIDHRPYNSVGRKHAQEAGVEDKIQLIEGPAEFTMQELLDDHGPESFNLGFIDGNKESYPRYIELAMLLLQKGGLLIVDNTSGLGGRVVNPEDKDQRIEGIREANDLIYRKTQEGELYSAAILPVADGITLAVKQ